MREAFSRPIDANQQLEDDTLAVAAEWIRFRDINPHERFGSRAYHLTGFIQGRLRIIPPDWWKVEMRRGTAAKNGFVAFPCRGREQRWKGNEKGWQYSGVDNVSSSDNQLTIESGKLSITLEKDQFPDVSDDALGWNHEDDGAIVASLNEQVSVIGFRCSPGAFAGPEEIYCIESISHVILWRRKISVNAPPDFGIGGHVDGSYAEIVIDRDRVIVWVSHDYSMGFEVFRLSDGERLGRFAAGDLNNLGISIAEK
jgi:hypothetical protein